jgi:hypothetical protein
VYVRAERPANGSVMVTFFSVTLPVFFAEKAYVMTSPALEGS